MINFNIASQILGKILGKWKEVTKEGLTIYNLEAVYKEHVENPELQQIITFVNASF